MSSPDATSPEPVNVNPDAVGPEPADPAVVSPGTSSTPEPGEPHSGRRWLILLIGLVAMTAGCTFQYGLAYLIPALRHAGFSLELASILVACPTAGLLLTLIGWGYAADRWGERVVLASGLAVAGVVLALAALVHGPTALALCLALGGAAGGSVFAASGRLILGWFARHERGLAMGIRQSAQPLGVALAAATLPALGAGGLGRPLVFLGSFCLLAAVLVVVLVRDPVRVPAQAPQVLSAAGASSAAATPAAVGTPAAAAGDRASPYRQPVLWRIHVASALLVVSQFTVATFALVFLVDARGWTALAAGRLLAVTQVCGAASRLGAGYWSDRVGSRMRPMRVLAIITGCRHARAGRRGGRRLVGRGSRPAGVRRCRREHQRARVHRGRRVRRIGLGRPGARRPEHRTERPGGGHATGPGAGHRLDRIRRVVRGRSCIPACRGGVRARMGGGRRHRCTPRRRWLATDCWLAADCRQRGLAFPAGTEPDFWAQ